MNTATLQRFMTTHPHSIRLSETVAHAEEQMRRFNCHHLPVLDGGKLVGVLSDRDVRLVAAARRATAKVEEICVDEPVELDVDTSVAVAARVMAEKRISSVLVMQEGKLAGIFTTTDACRALAALAG